MAAASRPMRAPQRLALVLALTLSAGFVTSTPSADANGGCTLLDEDEGVYKVGSAAELLQVGTDCPLDGAYLQTGHIHLRDGAQPLEWTPIGTSADPFTGTYDGAGFKIQNLKVEMPGSNYVGLFGSTRNAEITDVRLEDVDITGHQYVGALTGEMTGGRVTGSSVTGTVDGGALVGGLIGYVASGGDFPASIEGSYGDAEVTGGEVVGGLVGQLSGFGAEAATIEDSYATGHVSGAYTAGGLAGNISTDDGTARVERSYATGSATSAGSAGGLVAEAIVDGDGIVVIEDVYATGDVSGVDAAGGLAGNIYAHDGGTAGIRRSYATGSATSTGSAGGLVADATAILDGIVVIEDVYATGDVSGVEAAGGLAGNIYAHDGGTARVERSYAAGRATSTGSAGGLVGASHGGQVTTSFWSQDWSGQQSSAGGTAKGPTDMRSLDTYDPHWSIGLLTLADRGPDSFRLEAAPTWQIVHGVSCPFLTTVGPGDDLPCVGSGGESPNPPGTGGSPSPAPAPQPPAPVFSDVSPDGTHTPAITRLQQTGCVSGYADGTFRPGRPIRRDEFASIAACVMALPKDPGPASRFTDLAPTNRHLGAIGALTRAGLTNGCTATTFCPDAQTTRGQAASFLARPLNLAAANRPPFSDITGSTHAAAIAAVAAEGIVNGYADGTFRPHSPVSRGQTATMLVTAFLD